MEPGVQGSLSVSGVQCMAFRIHDLTWVVGTVWDWGRGVGFSFWFWVCSGVQVWTQGPVFCPDSVCGICEVMVIGSNSMPAGVPELGCGEEGNVM